MSEKVLVGLSGGIHSAVTAALLKNQGYSVVGLHLKFAVAGPLRELFPSRCMTDSSAESAKRICARLEISCIEMDVADLFDDKVVDVVVHEALQERFPNPCVPCNSEIKFKLLQEQALALGCQRIATGHRASVEADSQGGAWRLIRAADSTADQSYFLYRLGQAELRTMILPLGNLSKTMIQKMACELGFEGDDPTASVTGPSTCETCLSKSQQLRPLLQARVAAKLRPRGVIRTLTGDLMGEHDGLCFYRIGQREGMELNNLHKEQFYVVDFDAAKQSLVIGPESKLWQTEAMAVEMNWIKPLHGLKGFKCEAQFFPTEKPAPCSVTLFENQTVRAVFDAPQKNLLPGQALVFYDGDEVIGGGRIQQIGFPRQ